MTGRPRPTSRLATDGARIEVRVTPRAARAGVAPGADGRIAVRVAVAPDGGTANREVRRLLAGALGIAPSRLRRLRGASGRDEPFEVV